MISASLVYLLKIIEFLIFVRVIISWFPIDRYNPIIQFLYQITEPLLAPVRNLIQRSSVGGGMMIDFSPLIVILLIEYLAIPLIRSLGI